MPSINLINIKRKILREKNSWERQESNLGPLGVKRERYPLCSAASLNLDSAALMPSYSSLFSFSIRFKPEATCLTSRFFPLNRTLVKVEISDSRSLRNLPTFSLWQILTKESWPWLKAIYPNSLGIDWNRDFQKYASLQIIAIKSMKIFSLIISISRINA